MLKIDDNGRIIRPPDVPPELARKILKQPYDMSIRDIAQKCKCSTTEVRAVWAQEREWRERLKG